MSSQNDLVHSLLTLTLSGLGHDVLGYIVIWVAVIAIGSVLRRLLVPIGTSLLTTVVVTLALGLCGYGLVLTAIGFLPVLRPTALLGLSVASTGGLLWCRRDVVHTTRELWVVARRGVGSEWVVAAPAAAVLGIAFLAGFRPPFASDELAYHWPAALLWAHAGRWVTSPYRLTNSFKLAETIYTVAAVFKSSTAAHWTDTSTLVMLALGTASLARSFGGSGVLAAAATVALPVATRQSWFSYNDVFAASLLVAACALIMEVPGGRGRWTTGILVAGAVSTKPTMLILAVLPVLMALLGRSDCSWPRRLSRVASAMSVPILASVALWLSYSWLFTHQLFQRGGVVVARFGVDPSYGLATVRIPTLPQLLEIPILPFLTAVLGQREPYGDRTSAVLFVFIPIIIYWWVKMGQAERRRYSALMVPTLISYLIVSVVIVRTRYLIPIYCSGLATASACVVWLEQRGVAFFRRFGRWIYRLLVLVGLFDAVRHAFAG